jgi:sodium transport system permease protein
MRTIITVLRKEIRDTLRDKRTLISAIVLPAVAIPLLLFAVIKLQSSMKEKESNRTLKIAMINAPDEMVALFTDPKIEVIKDVSLESAKDSIANEKYDAALEFTNDFSANVQGMGSGMVNLHFKSTNLMVHSRITGRLDEYEAGIKSARMKQLNISEETLDPVVVNVVDVASVQEQLGNIIGGIIPYLFIIFCFTGCMYPALDIITGEKEKGTIETLLTVPASRLKILIGKTLAIGTVGIFAALMTICGMFVSLKYMDEIPPELLSSIQELLSVKFIIMLFAMLIPLSIFFAGVLSAVAIRANSFKEAQSYVTPLMFVVVLPAMLSMIPGVELNWQTVFIPILNVSLATKEIIAGTIDYTQYFVIVLSLIVLALLAVFGSYKQFSKESMVLK